MSNPADIFNKLQLKVFTKANKLKVQDEVNMSPGFVAQQTSSRDDPDDDHIDVPHVAAADNDYVTNRAVGLPGPSTKGDRIPLESKKPKREKIAEVEEPSDDVPDPSELAAGSGEEGGAEAGADMGDMGGPAEH